MENGNGSSPMRVMPIYGTRPEAIKLAPVIQAVARHPDMDSLPVVTGQHRAMLDQVNRVFQLSPVADLNIHSAGQTLNDILAKTVVRVDEVLKAYKPDVVVVQGDTSSAMAAALASFNHGIPVVHVEAGLRTGDLTSPFPEEANRRLVSEVAAFHFAPTVHARRNLEREGLNPSAILVTGNTVIDALHLALASSASVDQTVQELLDQMDHRQTVLITAHRRENLGPQMVRMAEQLRTLAAEFSEVLWVFPLHKNPAVRSSVVPHLQDLPNMRLLEPLPYYDFCRVLNSCDFVLSDSGGIQEEAPALAKPVLVMRDTTERPEGVEAGTARLIGMDLLEPVGQLLQDRSMYNKMARATNPYGDGMAATRIVSAIDFIFQAKKGSELPAEFVPR